MSNYKKLIDKIPTCMDNFDEEFFLLEFPELEKAKDTPQDPVYHGEGDVWTHTKMVVAELLSLPSFNERTISEKFVLFYAALLHDISKYRTTKIDEITGKISQPGHSKKGAIESRLLLWKKEVPYKERELVCNLIANHQLPFFIVTSDEYLKKIHKLSWELSIDLLCDLAEADIRGRICPDVIDVLTNIELLREISKEEGCFNTAKTYRSNISRLEYARHGKGHPDFEMYKEQGSSVILMCGMPASGKNTWVSSNYPNLPVVSFDDSIEELGLKHGKNVGAAIHAAIDKAKDFLRNKKSFVWNATHLSQQMRDKSLDLLFSYNATVEIVYLECSYSEVLKRNSKRDSTLTNKRLEAMLSKWEPPLEYEADIVRIYAK